MKHTFKQLKQALKHLFIVISASLFLTACTGFGNYEVYPNQYTDIATTNTATTNPNSNPNNPFIPSTEAIILPATIVLAPGFTANFSNGVSMSFTEVYDSRCPSGATCVQAGDARIELQLLHNNQVQRTTLSTAGQPNSILFQGLNIQLHEIRPYPTLNRPTNQNDFRVILHAVEQ